MTTIGDMKPGDIATVEGFSGHLDLQSRLVEMGILPGVDIRLVKATPFGGPVELKVRDYYVSVRKNDACHIQVTIHE